MDDKLKSMIKKEKMFKSYWTNGFILKKIILIFTVQHAYFTVHEKCLHHGKI